VPHSGTATFAAFLAVLALAAACADSPTQASPAGFQLAVALGTVPHQAVALVAVRGGAGRVVKRYSIGGVRSFSWRPGRQQLAVVTAGSNTSDAVVLLRLADGSKHVLADARRKAPAAFFGVAAWAPAGDLLAVTHSVGTYGARLELLDGRSGRVVRSFRVWARFDSRLSWSSDGKAIFFAQQQGPENRPRLRRLVVSTGEVHSVGGASGQDPAVNLHRAVAFSAGGGIHVAAAGRDSLLRGSREGDRSPVWSSDQRSVIFERPFGGCPRSFTPNVCTHIFVVPAKGGIARQLLRAPARTPAAR
jgi:dipeptidyl aminopeptidase/acylaminoacyl peptidase